MEAIGSPELITNMRRGRVPSVERFRALCEVLDLEFYAGPRRESPDVDEERLVMALEAAERGLATSPGELDLPEKARLVAAVYQLIGPERGPADAARLRRMIALVAGGSDPGASSRGARMAKAPED